MLKEPEPDLAKCGGISDCTWKGKVGDCIESQDGDWEVEGCPECGGIVEYEMSDERNMEWGRWRLAKKDRIKYEKINIQTREQHAKYLVEVEKLVDLDPKKETIEGQRLDILAKKVEDYEKLNFT